MRNQCVVIKAVVTLAVLMIGCPARLWAGVVFVEDFEDPAHVTANWSPYGSAFSVSSGVGTLWPDGSVIPVWEQHKATMHDQGDEPITFGDLTYEVDVKLPSIKRTKLAFGSDAEDRVFWVGYDISSAELRCDNHLEDNSRSAGSWFLVEDYRPYDNQWHRWRVEVSGSDFNLYIDNHHVITGQLDGYLPGPIGMRSWNEGGAQFDNLVASPEPATVLLVGLGVPILSGLRRKYRAK